MTGGYSNLNFMVFIILAIGGAFLAFSVRRILFKIRETERRIAATVDEKNEAAADLRVARQQEEQLLQALEEGEEALREIARRTEEVQNRMAVLRQATPRPLNLVSLEWAQGDHLYEAHLRNVVAPRHVGGHGGRTAGGMAEAGVVHGYAPTEADFRALVTNRLANEGGYIISSVLPISLGDEGPALDGAGVAPVEPPAEDEPLGDLVGGDVAGDGAAAESPALAGPKPLPVRPPAAMQGMPRGMGLTPAPVAGG
ncbi:MULTISPECIES: hypothetical protein [Nitrospirillum]|uniref:Uncharacterized protein n=1 Tax=Nitrospirillum amazonense TaxID=28077 RepID=A0A560FRN2_9PROT|nr:hypothetical protein [Nitrospirillum amazonense]MEC4591544.1 hypothetical protein [Nitrospirillum amazonense]TWB24269.1 hypothetical protein FBZ88_112123 [Nitrospirillum amazonense]